MPEINILAEEKPKYKVTLGGKEYELPPFNLNTMVALEERFGSFDSIGAGLQSKKMATTLGLLTILLRKYPELTADKIGDLVGMSNLTEVSTQIAKAIGG